LVQFRSPAAVSQSPGRKSRRSCCRRDAAASWLERRVGIESKNGRSLKLDERAKKPGIQEYFTAASSRIVSESRVGPSLPLLDMTAPRLVWFPEAELIDALSNFAVLAGNAYEW
jgi:hypothetical protein